MYLIKQCCIRFKCAAVCLPVVLCIVFSVLSVKAQPNKTGYNDVARQRLLIRIVAQYLHTISQGQIDMDSAIFIPSKLYGLSPILAYNEVYSDGTPTEGNRLLNAGKIKEAKALLLKTTDKARLQLLTELAAYFVFKPGADQSHLDEAERYLNAALPLIKQASVLCQIETKTLRAQLFQQQGKTDDSRKAFDEAIALAEHSGNKTALAQTLLNLGGALHFGDPARLANFERALKLFRTLNNKEKIIETLSQINIEHFVAKRYDVAEGMLLDIIKLQKAINFSQQQYPFDGLAYLTSRKAQLTRALEFSNQSLDCIKSPVDSIFLGFFYTRRGLLYERLLKYEDALAFYNKALAVNTKEINLFSFRPVMGKASILNFLDKPAQALVVLQQYSAKYPQKSYFEQMHLSLLLGRSYDNLKKNVLAETNYEQFLAMAANFPAEYIHDEFPVAYYRIAMFYRMIGNTKKARELLEIGRRFNTNEDTQGKGSYYYNLFKIDSAEKKYLNAIRDLQKSYDFADSAFSYDQIKKTRELLIKYEAEKKDKDIQLLNSQKQVAQVMAKEANTTKNKTLLGLGLLAVILVLIVNQYVNKQNANRKLEANQKELDQKNIYLEKVNTDKDKLLKEKEWLIKEVHHRVKNNLQMVTSLLFSQSVYLEDKASVLAIKDSLRRMQAMSLIHQKLYQDNNTTTIAMPGYFKDLVSYLHDSFDAGEQIIFKQHIEEIDLDVAQAVPLGLIVTESIVNAIKYAFLNGQDGVVTVSLRYDGPDHLILKVSDNGIGLPEGIAFKERNSLGLDLIQGLARQLNGKFKIENNNGAHITVRFVINVFEKGQEFEQ